MNANQPKPMPIVVSGSPRLPQHSQTPQMATNLANPLVRTPSSSSRSSQHFPRPQMTMKQADPPIHAPSNPQRRPTQYPPTLSDGHNANGFSLSATISRATTASPSDYTPAKTSCARRLWFFNFSAGTAITAHCTYKSIGISYTGRYSSTAAAFAS